MAATPTPTPMMRQYLELKEKYQDCILFFRLGDFYEMFFDDAKLASKELELTLTARTAAFPSARPCAECPITRASAYISRLIEKGYKVAVCEQLTDPALSKGLVERDVIRIVTPARWPILPSWTKKAPAMCCAWPLWARRRRWPMRT